MSDPHPNRPDRDLQSLLAEDDEAHDDGRRRTLRAATLWGPIAVTLGLLIAEGIMFGAASALKLVGLAVAIFVVFGKFAILLGASGELAYGPWQLAGVVTYMDVTIATLLVLNLPRFYRLPRVGQTLEDLAEHGLYMLERRPWLGRVTFLGVVAFVMFPLTGTGAVGGSIFGRLLGLSARRTLLAIAIGATLGTSAMAAFATQLSAIFTEDVRQSWEFKTVSLSVLGLLILAVWHRGRRVTRELRARREQRG